VTDYELITSGEENGYELLLEQKAFEDEKKGLAALDTNKTK
jgi:hypothetical protein